MKRPRPCLRRRRAYLGWMILSLRPPPRRLAVLVVVALAVAVAPAAARTFKTEVATVRSQVLARGLVHPWGLAFLPDGSALVTERPGRLRLFADGRLSRPISGVPKVWAHGQGGLLGLAISRDFASSGTIFLAFAQANRRGDGAGTAVARAKFVRHGLGGRLEDVKIIFSTKRKTGTRQFGARIVVMPDGSLFVTTGDGGQEKRAQDPFDAAGSVLHINPDGSIPADNPFRNGKKGLPAIWSIGHRNIDGATLDGRNRLWTVEHGPMGGDELNMPEAGKNYGWPVISYGLNYDGTKVGIGTAAPGYQQPVYYWDPSIAPSGLAWYHGDMFPEWRGDFLVGALKYELVSRLTPDASGRRIVSEERMFKDAFGRIRDVVEAPDGSVWLLTDEADGEIVRLSNAGAPNG